MSDSDLALVRARRAAISREIEELEAEDEDLEITERTLARLQAQKTKSGGNGVAARVGSPAPVSSKPMSQPEYVLGTLRAAADPWIASAGALQEMVEKVHGVAIPTNSFHPIISNLAKRGVILRDGPKIALAERVRGH